MTERPIDRLRARVRDLVPDASVLTPSRFADVVSGASAEFEYTGTAVLDPDTLISSEIDGARRVDDDGTFASTTALMTNLLIRAHRRGSPSDPQGPGPHISLPEATAWRNILLPSITDCYVIEPAAPRNDTASVWRFVIFTDREGAPVQVPPDFDWVKYRSSGRGLTVSRLDFDGNRIATMYRRDEIPPFYRPSDESRGRHWEIAATPPPPGHVTADCFDSLVRTIARRGVIADNIRPLSIEWTHGQTVDIVLRLLETERCYRIERRLPTPADLATGRHLLTPTYGDLPAAITSPEQYGAAEVARFRTMGSGLIAAEGTETPCN